jgi:ubiquitin-conjugating enzyme E2 H
MYATVEALEKVEAKQEEEEDEDQEMSDVGTLSDDDEVAGRMDL